MRILALDMATTTGWAAKTETGVTSGTHKLTLRRGESEGMRFLRFRAWVKDILELVQPDVVAYEAPHHRGGHATALAVGLRTILLAEVASRGIEHTSVHTATLKKHATGNGRASKDEMIAAACQLGYAPSDDNEADALHVLHWALEEVGE